MSSLAFYAAMGVVIGGRLGYVLFYSWSYFIAHPLYLFQVWKGGMSSHGGIAGLVVAMLLYARQHRHDTLCLLDVAAATGPIGIALGRIANFINGWKLPRSRSRARTRSCVAPMPAGRRTLPRRAAWSSRPHRRHAYVISGPGNESDPAFTPDGDTVYFARNDESRHSRRIPLRRLRQTIRSAWFCLVTLAKVHELLRIMLQSQQAFAT